MSLGINAVITAREAAMEAAFLRMAGLPRRLRRSHPLLDLCFCQTSHFFPHARQENGKRPAARPGRFLLALTSFHLTAICGVGLRIYCQSLAMNCPARVGWLRDEKTGGNGVWNRRRAADRKR